MPDGTFCDRVANVSRRAERALQGPAHEPAGSGLETGGAAVTA